MSEASVAPPPTTNDTFVPNWICKYSIPTVKFNGDNLKQETVFFIHENVVNLYIS